MQRYRVWQFGGAQETDDGSYVLYSEAQAEIDRLTAENGRLREALNSIANDDMAVCDSCDAYQETAKAALEGGEHGN